MKKTLQNFPDIAAKIKQLLDLRKRKVAELIGPLKVTLNTDKARKLMDLDDSVEAYMEKGPIDSVLGYMNNQTGEVAIDILEILFYHRPNSVTEFDQAITETVCHELKHLRQRQDHGFWFFKVKTVVYWVVMIVYLAYFHLVTRAIGLFTDNILLLSLGLYFDVTILSPLVRYLSYRYSLEEIGARKFAAANYKKPEWADIVIIEESTQEEVTERVMVFAQEVFSNETNMVLKLFLHPENK
ncbi:MAG: hypothetical protein ABH884_00385 [Candidatus Komeilibacteria bacterium]